MSSIEVALAVVAGATNAPHSDPLIDHCRKELYALLPLAVALIERQLRAGDLDVARQLVRITKRGTRLLPAGIGLRNYGRNDLNEIAAWIQKEPSFAQAKPG